MCVVGAILLLFLMLVLVMFLCLFFFFSSRRRHTRCALVTGVQTCALPILAGDELPLVQPGQYAQDHLARRASRLELQTGLHRTPLDCSTIIDRKSTRLNSSH